MSVSEEEQKRLDRLLELQEQRHKAERKLEHGQAPIAALHLKNGRYVDLLCYDMFEDDDKGTVYATILATPLSKVNEALLALHDIEEIIDDFTVGFESYPGQIIPLKGIFCSHCHAELYEAYQYDPEGEARDKQLAEQGWGSSIQREWGEDE